MGSSEQPEARSALGPFWAIVRADLGGLFRSKLTYGWLLVAVFIQVIRTVGSRDAMAVSAVVPSGLGDLVYIWALVLIGLSASSVSSEAGELADSILSKSVTRLDYILAKFVSRISYTLATFSAVTLALVGLGLRLEVGDYDPLGLLAAVLLVALALVMLTTMGVGLSVATSSSVLAIVTLLVLWYAMTVLSPVVGLGALSPGSLLSMLPDLVKGVWTSGEWESALAFTAVSAASVAISAAYFHMKDI